MSDYLISFLDLVWAARYVLAVVVFLLMVAWIADLVSQRDRARKAANALVIRNAELTAEANWLRAEVHAVQRRHMGKAPIIRGRVVS